MTFTQGFIQSGGVWAGISPPFSPEILKLSMVIIVLSQVLNNNLVPDCIRSHLRGSKFKIFLGRHAPSTHTSLRVRERAFAHYYHPATILFPPPPPPSQLKILYETLVTVVSFPHLCTDILRRTSMHCDSSKPCPIHLALYTCMDGCAHH